MLFTLGVARCISQRFHLNGFGSSSEAIRFRTHSPRRDRCSGVNAPSGISCISHRRGRAGHDRISLALPVLWKNGRRRAFHSSTFTRACHSTSDFPPVSIHSYVIAPQRPGVHLYDNGTSLASVQVGFPQSGSTTDEASHLRRGYGADRTVFPHLWPAGRRGLRPSFPGRSLARLGRHAECGCYRIFGCRARPLPADAAWRHSEPPPADPGPPGK